MVENPLPTSPLSSSDAAFQRMEDGDNAAVHSDDLSSNYAPPVHADTRNYAHSSSPMMIDSNPNPLDESYESFATVEDPEVNKHLSILSRTIVWLIGLGLFGIFGVLFLFSLLAVAFGGTLITIPSFVNALAFIICTTNFAFRRFATLADEEREAWKNLMWACIGILTWDLSMLLTSYILWIFTGWFFNLVAPGLESLFIIFIFPFTSATLATWVLWKLFPSTFYRCYQTVFNFSMV